MEDSGSIEIQLCGLSLHTQPFRQTYRHGLDIYIFRLQTEGLCEIWMDGGYRRILPGELLLFQPGELYEMRTVQNLPRWRTVSGSQRYGTSWCWRRGGCRRLIPRWCGR